MLARLLAAAWLGASAAGCSPQPARVPSVLAPPEVLAPQIPPCLRIARIEVSRSERRLRATCERGGRVELSVALGRDGEAPKRSAGDLRTPEGLYRVSAPPRPSWRYHLFIPIDYPSLADAETALDDGRLSGRDYWRIRDAHERGDTPPADTSLGGDIGFHGEGARWAGDSAELDWTLGCIAVRDADLDYLIARIEPGIPVEIFP